MISVRSLTVALAGLALATHVGAWALSPSVTVWAQWFYAARSFEGVLLFTAVLVFAHLARRVSVLLLVTCVFGALMETLAGVCATVFYAGGGVTPVYEVCENTQAVTPWLLLTAAAILALVAKALDHV